MPYGENFFLKKAGRKREEKNTKGTFNNLENSNETQISIVWQLSGQLLYLLHAAEKDILETHPFVVSKKELRTRSMYMHGPCLAEHFRLVSPESQGWITSNSG